MYIYGNVPVTHSLFYTPSLRCIFGNIVIVVTTIVCFNRFLTVSGVQPRLYLLFNKEFTFKLVYLSKLGILFRSTQ